MTARKNNESNNDVILYVQYHNIISYKYREDTHYYNGVFENVAIQNAYYRQYYIITGDNIYSIFCDLI